MRFLKFPLFFTFLFSGKEVMSQSVQDGLKIIGRPVDKALGFQPAVTEMARDLQWLDNFLLVIVTFITVFVTGLLLYATVRFSKKNNPVPASFTHNSPLEVAWTRKI